MVVYFGVLLILSICHGRSIWKEQDWSGLLALVTITFISAAVGVLYYRFCP